MKNSFGSLVPAGAGCARSGLPSRWLPTLTPRVAAVAAAAAAVAVAAPAHQAVAAVVAAAPAHRAVAAAVPGRTRRSTTARPTRAPTTSAAPASTTSTSIEANVNVTERQRQRRQQRLLQQRLGQRLSPGRHGGRGRRDGGRDLGRRRLDGAHRAAGLRAGELRRHGLPAVRQHLVPAAGIAVRRRQSAVLMTLGATTPAGLNRFCRRRDARQGASAAPARDAGRPADDAPRAPDDASASAAPRIA